MKRLLPLLLLLLIPSAGEAAPHHLLATDAPVRRAWIGGRLYHNLTWLRPRHPLILETERVAHRLHMHLGLEDGEPADAAAHVRVVCDGVAQVDIEIVHGQPPQVVTFVLPPSRQVRLESDRSVMLLKGWMDEEEATPARAEATP